MTSMKWLSLTLFCMGAVGFSATADAQSKHKKKRTKAVEAEETKAAEPEEADTEPEAPTDAMTPEKQTGSAGYKGGFFINDDDGPNKLTINGRAKTRFTVFNTPVGDDRINSHAFSIPVARLSMKGNAYSERAAFKVAVEFGKGRATLKDYFFDFRVGKKETRLRVGQFKKPFSRQQLTSDAKMEFVGRSIVDKFFGNGRDIGIELHSGFMDKAEVEWALGVFNGTGEAGTFNPVVEVNPTTMESEVVGGSFSNIPNKVRPAVVARVGYNANGIKGYSEADLEGGDLRYAVGAASMTHFRLGGNTASSRAGVDFVIKQDGISATGGLYADMQGPKVAEVKYSALGGYVQTGFMVGEKYQPALRYAVISKKGGDTIQEISGVFSMYEFKHGLKWQTDFTMLNIDDGERHKDYRGRTQIQFGF